VTLDIRVTNDLGPTRTDEIVAHLHRPRLWVPENDYPDYLGWLERAHAQLKLGSKQAMVALSCGNVVGVVLYQKHQDVPDTLEIKNISVRPEVEGRYLASFLLKNAEVEGSRDFKTGCVTVDTKASNVGMRLFLLRHRYTIQAEVDLYGLKAGQDLVFRKTVI
jgi:ribosomal protein S18 acetylase RimI-like enzyme